MAKMVCRICVAERGLRGSDLAEWWPDADDPGCLAWLAKHLTEVHGLTGPRGDPADADDPLLGSYASRSVVRRLTDREDGPE